MSKMIVKKTLLVLFVVLITYFGSLPITEALVLPKAAKSLSQLNIDHKSLVRVRRQEEGETEDEPDDGDDDEDDDTSAGDVAPEYVSPVEENDPDDDDDADSDESVLEVPAEVVEDEIIAETAHVLEAEATSGEPEYLGICFH